MLNLSKYRINRDVDRTSYRSYQYLIKHKNRSYVLYVLAGLMVLGAALMFLPWTQTIKAKGKVTTQFPNQRPQAIQSILSGKLENWYVQEGDMVKKGDTIVFISEVKDEYFDPELLARTQQQIDAKSQSVDNYGAKVNSLDQQYAALVEARDLKIEQTKNKIKQKQLSLTADSTDLQAFETQAEIAQNQFNRTEELYNKGIKSLNELEDKRLKLRNSRAKVVSQQNKILASINELGNLNLSLQTIRSEYADKMAKAQSDKFSARTAQLDATANEVKLKNQLSNYSKRQEFYTIRAPQDGRITQAIKKGVGEIIKEGTDIVTIMPSKYDLAVEIFVKPIDLPLIKIGQEVLLQFDGWPAIVFKGWPENSTGTFTGTIMAIDQFSDNTGEYRVLVKPNINDEKDWPEQLLVGSGSRAFILLDDVPVWYELWRQLNGFPANFYQKGEDQSEFKQKAPLKKVK